LRVEEAYTKTLPGISLEHQSLAFAILRGCENIGRIQEYLPVTLKVNVEAGSPHWPHDQSISPSHGQLQEMRARPTLGNKELLT